MSGLPVEAVLLVADVLDRRAHHAFDLLVGDDLGPRVSPAITTLLVVASVSQPRGSPRDRCPPWAFAEKQIDDLVGDPVANLVRMAFGNRLAGEQFRLTRRLSS
jgi:hypothetical protein